MLAGCRGQLLVMGVTWKYGQLGMDNKLALKKFKGALNRTRAGKSPSFSFETSFEGFKRFMDEVGQIPDTMQRPSLGRRDHSKGYEIGNIFWQELSENCAENGRRQGPINGKSRIGSKMPEEVKAKISAAMKGREFTAQHRDKLRIAALEQHRRVK